MLIGDVNPNRGGLTARHVTLQTLVDTLALTHVSRYPIEVLSFDHTSLAFRDTRFRDPMLAKLSIDSEARITIDSERITNGKFNQHNSDYHTRTTNDIAKMRKWLKEYVQPYTPAEVANLGFGPMKVKFTQWADHFQPAWREAYMNVNTLDVLKDIVHYVGGGQPYTTGKLAKYATPEFRLQILEHERRQKCEAPRVNVFINPDGVPWMTALILETRGAHRISSSQVLDSIDALPASEREKYSMLKMVDDGTYVENVGVRISYNNFWIHE